MRLAIVGLDSSHAEHFVRFINDSSRPGAHISPLQLVALVDISNKNGRKEKTGHIQRLQTLLAHPVLELAGSPSEITRLLSQNCDAVIIASRSSETHFAYAHALLNAGLPTFVDKPFTRTSTEAEILVQLAKDRNVPLTSFSALRWHPEVAGAAAQRSAQSANVLSAHGSATPSEYGPDFLAVHTVETALTLGPGQLKSVEVTRSADVVTAELLTVHNDTEFCTHAVLDCSNSAPPGFSLQDQNGAITPLGLDRDYLRPGFDAWLSALQLGRNPIELFNLAQTVAVTERITALV